MGDDVHSGRIEPQKKRFAVLSCLVGELQRVIEDLIIHCFHPVRTELTGVLDLLFADLSPSWLYCWVVRIGSPRMDHVPRSHSVPKRLRIVAMAGVLHRIEVVQITKELVETMHRGEELIP